MGKDPDCNEASLSELYYDHDCKCPITDRFVRNILLRVIQDRRMSDHFDIRLNGTWWGNIRAEPTRLVLGGTMKLHTDKTLASHCCRVMMGQSFESWDQKGIGKVCGTIHVPPELWRLIFSCLSPGLGPRRNPPVAKRRRVGA